MADTIGYSMFLKPDDVVRAWEERGALQPTVRWSEMMHQQHAVAFTVAKVAKLDLLRTIRTSLDDVIRNGGTFEQWQANILPELKKAGWWGAVSNRELTGTDLEIIVNERRLRTIYDTNVRMSIASGHWQRIQRQKDVLPYLRYLPSTSEHKRPLHMAWYGVIRAVDDPWWQTHFPPNGWHCKCGFQQLSERQLKKHGWTVTPPDQIADGPPTWLNQATGQIVSIKPTNADAWIETPGGIDPGFGYNPGMGIGSEVGAVAAAMLPGAAMLRSATAKASRSIMQALDAGLGTEADTILRSIIASPAFDQFMAAPSGAFPVAILSAEQQAAIQAKARMVVMPETIYRKQLGEFPEISKGHKELTPDDYRLLPDIVSRALVVAQQGTDRLIYFADAQGRLWKAVVRQDADRDLPAVVSFHRSEARKMRAETRHLLIMLDNR